jgi:hypothetical protein
MYVMYIGWDDVACGTSSTTIVQIALTYEREMPTAGRSVDASRSRCTARSRWSSSHLVAGNARQVHRNDMPDDFV